ncbi:DUF3847 domain-containing protein [Bacteroides caecimuris]|jgi:hypothetical protein|uniref:DUF3847 domain-containing protein n=1 Tax=Bacteroides caecimuris TaxID=1796613 RepID=UPI0026EA7FDF|nr:DUF3847 domain-containing protein [Bacteroides caecimuris]
MTKPKEKTIEELTAEIAANERKIQQYKNRKKIITQQISRETRRERNHRIFLYGGFMESIVPELKTMTEDEGKDFLYHIAKGADAQEYLKKRAERVEAG